MRMLKEVKIYLNVIDMNTELRKYKFNRLGFLFKIQIFIETTKINVLLRCINFLINLENIACKRIYTDPKSHSGFTKRTLVEQYIVRFAN